MREIDFYYRAPPTDGRFQNYYAAIMKYAKPPPEILHGITGFDIFSTRTGKHFILIPGSVIPVMQDAVPLIKAKVARFDVIVFADAENWYLEIGQSWSLNRKETGEELFAWMDGRTFNGTPLRGFWALVRRWQNCLGYNRHSSRNCWDIIGAAVA